MIKFPAMSRKNIEAFTEDILKHLQPAVLKGKAAFNVDEFIELIENAMEIDFDFTADLPPGVHGCTSVIDNKVLILSELADNPRNIKYLRSTVAHEIGHVILHVPMLRKLSKDITFTQKKAECKDFNLYSNKTLKPYEDPEWQAWEFAGSLLMPKVALTSLVQDKATVHEISKLFQINEKFVISRLGKLNML